MENTARLFIIVIGFCFLIAFVVWIFVAFSKSALFWKTQKRRYASVVKAMLLGCGLKDTHVNSRPEHAF